MQVVASAIVDRWPAYTHESALDADAWLLGVLAADGVVILDA